MKVLFVLVFLINSSFALTLKQRVKSIYDDDNGLPAARQLRPNTPNLVLWIKKNILNNSNTSQAEAYLTQLEAKHVEVMAAIAAKKAITDNDNVDIDALKAAFATIDADTDTKSYQKKLYKLIIKRLIKR